MGVSTPIWSPLELQEQDWWGGMRLASLQGFPNQSSVLSWNGPGILGELK